MPTANTRLAHVLLLAVGAYLCVSREVFAQTSDSQTTEDANKSWTATTDFKRKNVNPTRIIESHSRTAIGR